MGASGVDGDDEDAGNLKISSTSGLQLVGDGGGGRLVASAVGQRWWQRKVGSAEISRKKGTSSGNGLVLAGLLGRSDHGIELEHRGCLLEFT